MLDHWRERQHVHSIKYAKMSPLPPVDDGNGDMFGRVAYFPYTVSFISRFSPGNGSLYFTVIPLVG